MKNNFKRVFSIFLLSLFFLLPIERLFADTIDELKAKIAERENSIKQLEIEITQTQKQIDASRGEQKTLKNTIATYDAERKKLLAEITVAEKKISAKELEIESLGLNIEDKTKSVKISSQGLSQTIRAIASTEENTDISALLNNKTMSELWNYVQYAETVTSALDKHINKLKTLKQDLEKDKAKAEKIRLQLQVLKKELSGKKKVAEVAKAEQEKLLKDTKNKESEFQKMLQQKIATRDAFERELNDFESKLRFEIDPNSLPKMGSGILRWPLDIAIKITQYFGNTDFANTHTALYNGQGHNGIDLRAPLGTPIKVSLSGKIVGVGNTDNACPGASYGKWILVEHSNGLSTLYAHLSAFAVNNGENVSVGETIGWSGNTGYSTGPHLHFTVYATQGVRIMDRKSKVCNGTYTMPVADLRAYLNPLSYL